MDQRADIKRTLEQLEHDLARLRQNRQSRPARGPVELPAADQSKPGRPGWLLPVLVAVAVCWIVGRGLKLPLLETTAVVSLLGVVWSIGAARDVSSSENVALKIKALNRRIEVLARGGGKDSSGLDQDIEALRVIVQSLLRALDSERPSDAS